MKNMTSFAEYFYSVCNRFGDDLFLVELATGRKLSYLAFLEEVKRAAVYLKQSDLQAEDELLLVMENSVSSLVLFFGALIANVVPVPMSPKLSHEEMQDIFSNLKAKAIVVDQSFENKILEGIPFNNLEMQKYKNFQAEDFEVLMEDSLKKTAYICFTSGSTAFPKKVLITHKNMLSEIEGMVSAYDFDKTTRHLCVLPVNHASGLYRNILLPFHSGGKVFLSSSFDPENFWDLIEQNQITFVQVVPSILKILLLKSQIWKLGQEKSLEIIGSASAAHPQELLKQFKEKFAVKLQVSYGMTEATCAITVNSDDDNQEKLGSAGKPISVNEIQVLSESGEILLSGQAGEVTVRGSNITDALVPIPGEEEKAEDIWRKTGDWGYLDEDGFLWLLGRNNDLIKRGGYRFSPVEIENSICSLFPGLEVAVIGVPHPLLGQDIVAMVANAEERSIQGRDIISALKDRVSSIKIPSKVFFMEQIPKLETIGKIDRKAVLKYYESVK
jgi:acyl-CoA synthetase (AMP-forming)/AMP-acid ligase II